MSYLSPMGRWRYCKTLLPFRDNKNPSGWVDPETVLYPPENKKKTNYLSFLFLHKFTGGLAEKHTKLRVSAGLVLRCTLRHK